MTTTEPVATDAGEALAHELERVMDELVGCYRRLVLLARQRHGAIRGADRAGLAACVRAENEVVQAVASAERRRVAVVGELAGRLGSREGSQTRVTWVASALGGERGERIGAVAEELRGLIGELLEENRASRIAAESLARHMDGLVRQVAAALNHARTYGRGGSVEAGPRVVSALDVRS